jgi:hypothetical protein
MDALERVVGVDVRRALRNTDKAEDDALSGV